MEYKGLVVVPASSQRLATGGGHATQRVANRSIVCHAVEGLAGAGVADVAVVGPPAEMDEVRRCLETDVSPGITLTYIPQEGRADLLGAMQAAEEFVDDRPAIVHLADGLLGQQLDGLVQGRDPGTQPDLLLLLHRCGGARGGFEPATKKLLGLTELHSNGSRLAVAGVWAFGPRALRTLSRATGEAIDILTIAEQLAAGGSNLGAEVVRSWRRYSGDPVDLLELNRLVLDQQVVPQEAAQGRDNRIEGRAVIHPTADVCSSIILGPCIIGAGARILNSYIGPYTSIGDRADIEGAEIVRSIVAEDARISHVRGRIEGSTIGPGASIFRDFSLPRAMRLHVGEGVEVALN